jgi:hypothetical protein
LSLIASGGAGSNLIGDGAGTVIVGWPCANAAAGCNRTHVASAAMVRILEIMGTPMDLRD